MAQEELAANRTHQTGLEAQIQELKSNHGSLEQELAKRDQKLQKQEQTLKELQKQQVRQISNSHDPSQSCQVVSLYQYNANCAIQGQVKEALEKERSSVEELNNTKSVLEKNNSKLTSELKTLTEKSEKVSHKCRSLNLKGKSEAG